MRRTPPQGAPPCTQPGQGTVRENQRTSSRTNQSSAGMAKSTFATLSLIERLNDIEVNFFGFDNQHLNQPVIRFPRKLLFIAITKTRHPFSSVIGINDTNCVVQRQSVFGAFAGARKQKSNMTVRHFGFETKSKKHPFAFKWVKNTALWHKQIVGAGQLRRLLRYLEILDQRLDIHKYAFLF